MKARRSARVTACAVLLIILPSCGKDWLPCHPARSRVLLDGHPVEGAEIWLFPEDAAVLARQPPVRPYGKTDKDGRLTFTTYIAGDGAPAGTYKARVIWERKVKGAINPDDEREATKNVLPQRYGDPELSGLNVAIQAGDNTVPDFTLRK